MNESRLFKPQLPQLPVLSDAQHLKFDDVALPITVMDAPVRGFDEWFKTFRLLHAPYQTAGELMTNLTLAFQFALKTDVWPIVNVN